MTSESNLPKAKAGTDDLAPLPETAHDPSSSPEAAQIEESLSEANADVSTQALECPTCGLVNRPGELACSRCGTILATGGTTRKLSNADEPTKSASWPT